MQKRKVKVSVSGRRVICRATRDWRQRYDMAGRFFRRPWDKHVQQGAKSPRGSSLVETLAKSANEVRNRKIQADTTRRYLMADRPLPQTHALGVGPDA